VRNPGLMISTISASCNWIERTGEDRSRQERTNSVPHSFLIPGNEGRSSFGAREAALMRSATMRNARSRMRDVPHAHGARRPLHPKWLTYPPFRSVDMSSAQFSS